MRMAALGALRSKSAERVAVATCPEPDFSLVFPALEEAQYGRY